MKRTLLNILAHDRVVPLLRPLRRRAATIFTMHRFADPALGNPGHPLDVLRSNLAFLRRHGFHPTPLADLVATLEAGEEPRHGTVVFTVDDGYLDFATVAAPVFADYDCPVTVFLITGFLDGAVWMWWDRVWYMMGRTHRRALTIELEGATFSARWSTDAERDAETQRLAEAIQDIDEVRKQEVLAELEERLEVTPPARPPARYAPMSWDDVRRCATRGVSFGPHTVTHPMLARTDDGRAAREITESWARVRAETAAAVPVFCYPFGSTSPFAVREVREAGLRAAVTTSPRDVTSGAFTDRADGRFLLPRHPYWDDTPHFSQIVTGVERVKARARTVLQPARAPR